MEIDILVGIALTIMVAAFFSGVEMAFVSANKLYFELQAKQNILTGTIMAYFYKRTSLFIGAMLIGNTLALVLYGILMEGYLHELLVHYFPKSDEFPIIELLVPSVVATLIILLLGEFLPKNLFLINPDGFLEALAVPIWMVYWLIYPFVFSIVELSKVFIKTILRLEYHENKPVFGLTDLNNYLQNLNRRVSKEEENEVDTTIFNRAIEFRKVRVRDCLIPRTEITGIEQNSTIEELQKLFIESGHSKVIIYKESLENIMGYCHLLDLFKKPKNIQAINKPILYVPEAMFAHELMADFTKERKTIAVVVDEFGGISGLVSLEDLMEKIFGNIQDEYDESESWTEKKLDDHNYILSARHEIEYLNEKYGWSLPEGDYDTLGGLILDINQDIPELNEIVSFPPFTFTILSKEDARIDTLKLTLNNQRIEEKKGR